MIDRVFVIDEHPLTEGTNRRAVYQRDGTARVLVGYWFPTPDGVDAPSTFHPTKELCERLSLSASVMARDAADLDRQLCEALEVSEMVAGPAAPDYRPPSWPLWGDPPRRPDPAEETHKEREAVFADPFK